MRWLALCLLVGCGGQSINPATPATQGEEYGSGRCLYVVRDAQGCILSAEDCEPPEMGAPTCYRAEYVRQGGVVVQWYEDGRCAGEWTACGWIDGDWQVDHGCDGTVDETAEDAPYPACVPAGESE